MAVFMILALAAVHSMGHDPAANMLACTYSSRLDNDTLTHERCAWEDRRGRMHVSTSHLRRLDYDRFGLSAIFIGQWYYVRRDGRVAPTMGFDNWADDFHDGLARSLVNGKIGYIDRSLTLRIPAKYNGAGEFTRGFAPVCLGCTLQSGHEDTWYEGGVWGCIDLTGRLRSKFRALKPQQDANCPTGR
jgi:hypothetical protein